MSDPDEELRVAPRRVPRRVVVLLCVAAAGLLVAALLHRGGERSSSAAPSSARTQTATEAAPTAVRPSGSSTTAERLGGRLALADHGAAVLDAAIGGGVLYVLEYGGGGAPLHVLALRPGGRVRQVATLQSLGVPTIAVTGGSVWLAGYSDAGTAVVQLDATTFEPNTVSSPAAGLAGPGARVIGGTGLWVVSGAPGFEEAWCVDAGTGAVRGYWTGIAGSITAYRGSVLAVTGDGVRFGANAAC